MAIPSIKNIFRSPSGGLAIGLVAALLLASLASAGLNTLWVARGLVILCAVLVGTYVWVSDAAAVMTRREKIIALGLFAAVFLLLERIETWAQPKPKHFPVPPLMLMLRPTKLWTEPVYTQVPQQRFAASYIDRPQGGYAAFDLNNDADDPMLGIQSVDFANLSDGPLTISWELIVDGEGVSFTVPGTGKGKWERQLNQNDWLAEGAERRKLKWGLSPVTLLPHEKLHNQHFAFVISSADDKLKKLIVSDEIDESYKILLKFRELPSGQTSVVTLPFGVTAKETAVSKTIEAAVAARHQRELEAHPH